MLSGGGGRWWCWRGAAGEGGWCGSSAPAVAAMVHYTLEPQFNALVFSVSARHERFSLLPDPFVCCSHGPPATATDLLAYLHTVGVQLATLGDHYACLLTQVRAGSVIFLVGVGSLVCWKLWEHWRSGAGSPNGAPPTPSISPAPRRPRGLLATLLEEDLVQDLDDYEDEDPAFIHGKYFGPTSPCAEGVALEDGSPITDSSERSNSEARGQHYLADASNSLSAGEGGRSSSENSLPTDGESDAELFPGTKRLVKRKHRASELQRNLVSHRQCSPRPRSRPSSVSGRRHKAEARAPSEGVGHGGPAGYGQQAAWLSSESSPEYVRGAARGHSLPHHQAHGPETPDSEEVIERIRRQLRGTQHGRVGEYNGPRCSDSREQPEGEEAHPSSSISSASLSDLMDKMRHRAARGSVSRDTSVASNLSELVASPLGSKRFFRREDSVCSNLSGVSDLAPSEGSEMSLEVSVQEDLASRTFTCFNNIEHELDDLKSSMIEMDEEVTKFVTRPDPYSFKTTYSDYSLGSGESRPSSAMEILTAYRSRANLKLGIQSARPNLSSDSEVVEGRAADASIGSNPLVSGSDAEGSLEWDSPQHGWSSARAPPLSKLPELPSEDAESSHASVQDDAMPSLEWDNGCLRQYDDEVPLQVSDEQVFHPSVQGRHQLLPDHSSLELDLEEELMSPSGGMEDMAASPFCNAPMTISIDSAIQSGTGSRSASSSPVPLGMGHSFLSSSGLASSSSGLASSSEISPATPDSESTGWSAWERHLSPGEFGSKARRYWSSEESGYVEGLEAPVDSTHSHLSPVHEIREKENPDSSTSSTPLHTSSWASLNNNTTTNTTTTTTTTSNKNNKNNSSNNNTPVMGNKTSSQNDNSWSVPASPASPDQPTTALGTYSAVGPKLELLKYASTEWQGNTPKALTVKQGYSAIPAELNFRYLRQVRGDNYCGVRAALYQVLARGLAVPNGHTTHSRLASELTHGATWLREWTFGHRLSYSREEVLNGFLDCLDALDSLVMNLMGCENRECVVLARLNRDPLLDVRLCEAIKLHMLAAALDLHAANINGENVPLFAMIMFARHSSLTPRDLLRNHLNPVGDTAGLEQVEMFLLGHTLGVTLQVVRPASYGRDDFICYYPDANIGLWPEVTLVAEDDRHYNVLVK